jgi:hypothetical protein
MDLSAADWRKSSRSSDQGTGVEAATNLDGVVAVRDSKNPTGPVIVVSPVAWGSFLGAIKAGAWDEPA